MINPDPIQPFYVPLTEILKDRGYTGGDQDVSARTSFLFNIYEKAQVSISRNTLKDWFSGRRRPLFENPSRQKMYELCFVLEFNYDQVRDFLTAFISVAALTAAISGKPYTATAFQKEKTSPTPLPSLNRPKRSWKAPPQTPKAAPPSGLPIPWRRILFIFIRTRNF